MLCHIIIKYSFKHMVSYVTDSSGAAFLRWPGNIGLPINAPYEDADPVVNCGFNAIASTTFIERHNTRISDSTRRIGIFTKDPIQAPVKVYMFGFVKRAYLNGTGGWNGYVLQP